jgi:hypothetical protein
MLKIILHNDTWLIDPIWGRNGYSKDFPDEAVLLVLNSVPVSSSEKPVYGGWYSSDPAVGHNYGGKYRVGESWRPAPRTRRNSEPDPDDYVRYLVAYFFDSKPLPEGYHTPYGSFMHLGFFDPASVGRDSAAGIVVSGSGTVIVRGDLVAKVSWTVDGKD